MAAKERKIRSELNLLSLVDVIDSIGNFTQSNLDEIQEYLKNDLTKETAEMYLNYINELYKKIDDINVSEDNKDTFKKIIVFMITKMLECDSKDLMIDLFNQKRLNDKNIINKLKINLQNERDEHNIALKKLNEELKPNQVTFTNIELQITTKKNKKILGKDFNKIFNSLIEDEEKCEKLVENKLTRVAVPADCKKNISRAFAKKV